MNEMASLAEQTGVDIDVIRECIGSDPRIGRDYLYPGCGYGGKALEENITTVAKQLNNRHDDLGLLETVSRINDRQKDLLFRKIWKFFKTEIKNKTIAIWGASFKPGSSSLSGAPAVSLINSLIAHSVKVSVYDPQATKQLKELYGNSKFVEIVEHRDHALESADVLVICTEWKEFWSPDFDKIKLKVKEKVIFDGRNLYSPEIMKELGIVYFAVGRGDVL